MTEKESLSNKPNDRRRKAAEKAAKLTDNLDALSPEDIRQLLYELSLEQIELEMQNKELRTAHAKLEASQAPGCTPSYSVVMNDITKLKQAEDAQHESEERYRQLIRLSLEPIYMFDSKTMKILESNPAFETILGYTADEIKNLTIYDVIAHEQVSVDHHTNKIMAHGATDIGERQWRRKDGTLFPVHVTANKIRVKGDDIIFVTARDLTERKQAEVEKAELEAQNRQLQKAESLGRMAGAIAHHFNNQLQVVMGNLEMALNDIPRGVDTSKNLTAAMKAAFMAAEVSGLMLTYLGQTAGKHEPIDLSELCRRCLTLLQAAAPKGMILKENFPASGPVIRANSGQIQQILTNLVTNAWEASTENPSTIGLAVKTVSHANIPATKRFPIDWKPQEIVYACLEVADTGCGISSKDVENIFDPFFTTKFVGRGLGLPVVLGIVGSHGGGITVESKPGLGSVFRVLLPETTEKIPFQQKKNVPFQSIEMSGTVLLIEDEEMVCIMANTMLTHLGFRVLEARNGVEAVAKFKQHRDEIRFVLSDLTMPGMNGWDTLTALRKLSPGIPVILSSGYDETQVMGGDHPELPNAFLGKPYRLQELGDKINRVLSESL